MIGLTSVVRQESVCKRIRRAYRPPQPTGPSDLLVPPVCSDRQLVGTAFDYLLRFHVERLNPGAKCSVWIPERVVEAFEDAAVSKRALMVQGGHATSQYSNAKKVAWYKKDRNPDTTAKVLRDALERARMEYRAYVSGAPLRREMLQACCMLARLDWCFRQARGYCHLGLPMNWASPDETAADELHNLIKAVEPDVFRARSRCVVGPRFRTHLALADADILIDDRLIDIKVTTRYRQDQRDWDQLFGYYTLYRLGGIEGVRWNVQVRRLGIYSACFARYQEIDLTGEQLRQAEALSDWLGARLRRDEERRQVELTTL